MIFLFEASGRPFDFAAIPAAASSQPVDLAARRPLRFIQPYASRPFGKKVWVDRGSWSRRIHCSAEFTYRWLGLRLGCAACVVLKYDPAPALCAGGWIP